MKYTIALLSFAFCTFAQVVIESSPASPYYTPSLSDYEISTTPSSTYILNITATPAPLYPVSGNSTNTSSIAASGYLYNTTTPAYNASGIIAGIDTTVTAAAATSAAVGTVGGYPTTSAFLPMYTGAADRLSILDPRRAGMTALGFIGALAFVVGGGALY